MGRYIHTWFDYYYVFMNSIILLNCNTSSFRSQFKFMKSNSKKKKRKQVTHSIEKLIMRSIISCGPCGG